MRWNFFVYILWSYPFESGNDISSILLESIVVTTAPTQGENWAFAVTTPATSPRQVFFPPYMHWIITVTLTCVQDMFLYHPDENVARDWMLALQQATSDKYIGLAFCVCVHILLCTSKEG